MPMTTARQPVPDTLLARARARDLRDRWVPAPAAVKVPQVTVLFWVVKVLTTGTGEAASDYLAGRNLVLAAGLGLVALVVGLALQLRTDRYLPWAYWLAVSMVAVFGTMAADAVHVVLDIPYWATTVGYAAAVAGVFVLWHRKERTLDIHSISSSSREAFYWVAVLATFALGTAVGDLSAITLGLGYLNSAIVYAALIAVPALGWWARRLNPVVAFWWAYVLTRPLGASLADWLGKPADRTGLGWGDGPVTVGASLLIAILVAWLSRARPARIGDRRSSPATS
jgi:uncharacterized membrane-anchored protein